MATLVLVGTVVLALALGGQRAARAAARHTGGGAARVKLLAPRDGSRLGGRAVVRVRAPARGFRAYVDGHDVSRRFHRRAGVWVGVLRRDRQYRPGDVSLFVRAGAGRRTGAYVGHFYAVRRRDGSVSLRLTRRPRVRSGPLLHLRSRRGLRDYRVTLNGRRIDRDFRLDGDDRGIADRLAPHAGLRFGRNRLRVEALQRGGTVARKEMSFEVSRGRPLADAGRDGRVGVGEPIVLDAGASLPERPGAHLHYRWQVLQAPPGSRAQIPNAESARSRFVPDVAGTYVARVTVGDAAGQSVDDVLVEAPQTASPMGIPIETRAPGGGIQLGEEHFPASQYWVQMLVLKGGSAVPEEGAWGPANQGFAITESARLLEKVKKTTNDQLVILAGTCCQGITPVQPTAENLTAAVEYLGGTVQTWGPTPHGAEDLWDAGGGKWSLIGHAGLPRAAANQNTFYEEQGIPGFLGGKAGEPGSLDGYLQSVTTLGYEFVSSESVPIDTKWTSSPETPPSNTQNTIAVGTQHYESGQIENGAIAIQLLELNPSNLQLLSNRTFGVLKANGETEFGGIYWLDQALHEINEKHGVGETPLVVLQDFGHRTGWDWPGGNSPDWVQDVLPGTSDSRGWSGGRYPNSTEQLLKSWNQENVHGFGSVAGNLGELVGIPFHDVVANYHRPFFDPQANGGKGAMIERTSGGLTAIAEPHLYQWSSAFGQGQGNPALSGTSSLANGRVTGTLVRNQQSQWELQSAANGAGFQLSGNPAGEANDQFEPQALWNLAFQQSVPWPCSVEQPAPCPAFPAQIAAADRYIAAHLFNSSTLDVRQAYVKEESWDSLRSTMNEDLPYQPGRGFSRPVYQALRKQLGTEFNDLEEVKTGIHSWQDVIGNAAGATNIDVGAAAGHVTAAVQQAANELLKHEAEINVALTTSDALLIGSSAIDLGLSIALGPEELAFAPPVLGGISAILALGDDLFGEGGEEGTTPAETQQLVDDDTEEIRDTVGNLKQDLSARYVAINQTMGHFQDIFATDWDKLQEAADKFRTVWALESQEQKLVGQSISVGAEQQLFNATMPIAYSQWIISPQQTDINGDGPLELPNKDYQCRPASDSLGADGNYVDSQEPVGALTSVGYTGGSTGWRRDNYTVRMLKPWADNLEAKTTSDFNGLGTPDTYVPNTGGNPPEALINPLFEPTGVNEKLFEPTNLGMSKDAFFGQQMGMQMLQCGAVPETPEEEEEG